MKEKKKWIVGLVVLILVAVIVYIRVLKPEETVEIETWPTVAAANPQTGDIVLYTDLTGTVEPQSKATVQAKIGGEILEIFFQAGDFVEAGQVLCRIDSDSLTTLQLQVDAAAVQLRNANSTLERTRALYADGFASDQSLEQAEDSAESAQISYDSAKTQYDLQLEYTQVAAPISGLIENRDIELHDHIGTDTEICVISGQEQLQVNFGVTERILGNLSVGDIITVEKNGTAYEGNVIELGTKVNSTSGLYDVKALLPKSSGLSNGTRVKLTVVLDRTADAMTIPLDAVNYDDGTPFVYLYQDGRAVKTEIESGIYDSETMEVLSGLDMDDVVITSWSNELADGQEVLVADAGTADAAGADTENADADTAAGENDGKGNAE
ncbi:MAG: efflux RND transporter periplasmic adaptor subunit [Clostridiales bacterium]|nr:efflux RND transporter periplasmic adaptor subunit [Clostridiales bacterium]